ncbi:Ribosomal RNA processing protein 1 B [Terramyces sp. JEL0728]|nr:Ribosomal RNA processing protein 1 B [Terramyces sp. JEL0728]
MSDKPLIQQELAEKLSKLVWDLKIEVAFGYLSAFWKIIVKEWYGIDRLSIDKPNVPESLRYHTIQVFFDEFTKSLIDQEEQPKHELITKLLEPFLEFLKSSNNPVALDNVFANIMDSYYSEDGKKQIANYLTKWGDQVGIPFVHSKTVTSRTVEKVSVPFDEKSVTGAKKRKHDPSDEWEIVQKEEIAEYEENSNAGPEKKKKRKDKSEASLQAKKGDQPPKRKEAADKHKPEKTVVSPKKQGNLPVSGAQFYEKPPLKTPASSPKKSEKAFDELTAELAKAAEVEPEVVDSPSQSEDKKSVRWGPKQIKPFFRSSLICNPEEARTSPKTGSPAPKVLKKTNSPIVLAKRTVPARTSPRKKASDYM